MTEFEVGQIVISTYPSVITLPIGSRGKIVSWGPRDDDYYRVFFEQTEDEFPNGLLLLPGEEFHAIPALEQLAAVAE